MKKLLLYLLVLLILVSLIFYFKFRLNNSISVLYPFERALFPPEFPSTTFRWISKTEFNGNWEIAISNKNASFKFDTILSKTSWKPSEQLWNKLKTESEFQRIKFTVKRVGKSGKSMIAFSFSPDSVGAPILYRQMPIPFVLAEKILDSMSYVLINIGSPNPPHVTMRHFMVCGNCHSFTPDGKTMSLDLDAGLRDKGGYFISPIKDTTRFDIDNYMSWTKIEHRRTFGLFSKISPDGRYVVTTVKDRVLNRNFPYDASTNAFSQLFFPVNGHLGIYDRQTKQFHELPGANLDEYVQSNAIWTPDGKNIIFCRAKALPYTRDSLEINVSDDQMIERYVERKESLKYDLCIIPFNNGKGGEAVPIKGASDNNMSNYFPAVSPDGKWIVFCQAENFMLLQPDSRLFIVPLNGGRAEKLKCNLSLMNSWHAWSPNGKWIVFVSKGLSVYTDMFLSHIDENGNASSPVLLEKARRDARVANYPEFLNVRPDYTFEMVYDYVELAHIERAIQNNDIPKARDLYERFKLQNPLIYPDDFHYLIGYLDKMGLKDEIPYWKEQIMARK
jgi:hypothetical protein